MAGLIILARDTGEYDRPLDALKQMLHDRFAMKSVSLPRPRETISA